MGVHERKSDTVVSPTNRRRRRRTGSGGYGEVKRQAASSSRWLVDYRSKQADLSPNSLLRLQTLVEGGNKQSTQEDTQDIKVSQLQLLETGDFASFEDNSVSSDAEDSSGLPQYQPLSPPQSPPPQQQPGLSNSSAHCNNSLTSDSEHSINLEKVFESQHNAASKAQQALSCITVTISDQDEKIKFSLRNPEVLRALKKALAENGAQQQQQPEEEEEEEDSSSSEEKQQSASTAAAAAAQQAKPTRTTKRREIKCVIPHDRFQLPQMQVFRQPEQRLSNASTAAGTTTHHNLKLHCIDEANESEMMPGEESEISMGASMQSSFCDSFAGDSLNDDDSATNKSQLGCSTKSKDAYNRRSSLGIEEVESDSEEEEQHLPPIQHQHLQHQHKEEQPQQPETYQKPQEQEEEVQEEEEEEEEEEDSQGGTEMNKIIGLYVNDDTLRHSIAESTLAPSVVEELEAEDLLTADEAGDEFETDYADDDTETEVGYDGEGNHEGEMALLGASSSAAAVSYVGNNIETAYGVSISEVGYNDDSQTDHYGDSVSQIGNSGTTIGDSQTDAGYYGDSQSMVVYESETDRAYDGDDTEAAMEEEDAATALGAGTDQEEEEEESEDEYEEDMEEEEPYLRHIAVPAEEEEGEEEGEIRDEADEVESTVAGPIEESDAESEREAAEQPETDGEESLLTNGTDESSQNNNAMTRGLSVYLSAHSRKGNSGGGRVRKNSNDVIKSCNDSQTATSVTASMTIGMDASNMTNNTGSTGLTLKSNTTNGTSRSDPCDLLRHENSLRSIRSGKNSDLDECNRSMRLEDLSKNSRASSAPHEDSYLSRGSSAPREDSFSRRRRRPRPLGRMLSGDSQVSYDASKSSFFQNAESDAEDSTVASSVDHRRRRSRNHRRRPSGGGDAHAFQMSIDSRRRGSIGPNKSGGIIPRSNTPQGALLRTRSSDNSSISSSSRSRASIKGDARPLLPPRNISRDRSDNSHVTEESRRRVPRRSKSMIDSSSGTHGMGRNRGVNRTKSRESFMGGSRIKKWDGSAANRSGVGLSLLERHLDNGGKSTNRQSRRRSSMSASKAHNSIASMSVPSLMQSASKEV